MENSQKYGWCKMKLLELLITLITSNLFFSKNWKLEEPPQKKNAQLFLVHFYFSGGFTLSNSGKKVLIFLVVAKLFIYT